MTEKAYLCRSNFFLNKVFKVIKDFKDINN